MRHVDGDEPTSPPDTDVPGVDGRADGAGRWSRAVATYVRLTLPTDTGLPSRFVVFAFPVFLLVTFLVLVVLGVTGSSSGIWWSWTGHTGPDPSLIAGEPRPIRSDEWEVQASWIVSQYAQGFPRINTVFPGGTDATVMNDLPTWDWSTLFRPHLWGFLFMDLDHGMAWRWWLPVALMAVAVYFFTVTLLPKRPLLGASLALFVLFQPIVQWLWLPILPAPVAFAFATMAALVWGSRARGWWSRWLPALFAGYLAADMAMTIYVPFIIPALLTIGAFVIGWLLNERRLDGRGLRHVGRSMAPLAAAGVGAAAVLSAWVYTRRSAVTAMLDTVYPGQRSTPPGQGGGSDLMSLLSAPFQRALRFNIVEGLGPQETDAASPVVVSLFLVVPLVALLVIQWRRSRRLDWLVLMIIVVQLVALAWTFLPGWGPLARLLLLDRTLVSRMRLVYLVEAVVTVVVVTERMDRLQLRLPWRVALATAAPVLLVSGGVWWRLAELDSPAARTGWPAVITILLAVALVAVVRHRATLAGVLLLTGTVFVAAAVNPLYHGLFDLRETSRTGKYVVQMRKEHPRAHWVAIGDAATFMLVETGVHAYNGMQTYPTPLMWKHINPDGDAEDVYNRLALVTWEAGSGDPDPRLRYPHGVDQVRLTFDSCADFAQQHVDYVLADAYPVDQPCLREVKAITQGQFTHWVYKVVAPPS